MTTRIHPFLWFLLALLTIWMRGRRLSRYWGTCDDCCVHMPSKYIFWVDDKLQFCTQCQRPEDWGSQGNLGYIEMGEEDYL